MSSSKGNENNQEKNHQVQLAPQKITMHVQHTFFVRFFAIVLHEITQLPETFQLHVLSRKCCICSCSLYCSLPLIFTLGAASISHFLTTAIKCSCYSYDKIGFLCFLSLTPALSLLSISMQTLELSRKNESALLLFFFFFKSLGGHAIYRRNA